MTKTGHTFPFKADTLTILSDHVYRCMRKLQAPYVMSTNLLKKNVEVIVPIDNSTTLQRKTLYPIAKTFEL